ncbi:hypothetical protein J8V57_02820 [Xenorhabdus sp. PB61.4]|uniref:hypothetical protein n=1 Tax=Xenorhabdus sp. PB61.4 TaxID=2788940 RepID=UPI001E52D530|nr:hypothetical protein [Xenorhabdus sp. PB61.4]MCC8365218.1 hypothetical protein [Xenorhabdus sp. PB61.4]
MAREGFIDRSNVISFYSLINKQLSFTQTTVINATKSKFITIEVNIGVSFKRLTPNLFLTSNISNTDDININPIIFCRA